MQCNFGENLVIKERQTISERYDQILRVLSVFQFSVVKPQGQQSIIIN